MLETLKAMSAVAGWLAAGGTVVVAAVAVAWFVPFVRQFALGVAVAAAVAVFYAGHLVKLEHDVCEAKQAQAEAAAAKRDADIGKAAKDDEGSRQSQIDQENRKDKEADDAFEKARAKAADDCRATVDDIR